MISDNNKTNIMESFSKLHCLTRDIQSNNEEIIAINLNYDYLDLDENDDFLFDNDDAENDDKDTMDTSAFNACIEELCTAISQNDKIQQVQLFWDFMEYVTAENRSKLCQALQNLTTLKCLSIFYDDEELPLSDLVTILDCNVRDNRQPLETLDLNNVLLTGCSHDFMRLCNVTRSKCRYLKEFLMYNVEFEAQKNFDSFMTMVSQLPNLETILIQNDLEALQLSKESVRALCQMPSLKTFTLETFELSSDLINGVTEGLHSNSKLEKLTLCGENQFEYSSVSAITNALKQSKGLQELHLKFENSASSVADADACVALEEALSKSSSLKRLTLDGLELLSDQNLAKILHENSSLEKLCLTNTSMQYFVESAKALADNSTLKCLHLCNNSLKHDSGVAIAKALQTNSTLTVLNVSNNTIGEAACIEMASSLSCNQTLKHLNIDSNLVNICNDCCSPCNNKYSLCPKDFESKNQEDSRAMENIANAFIAALEHNSTILSLSMDEYSCQHQRIPAEHLKKLKFYLQMNECGRNALFKNLNHMSQDDYIKTVSQVGNNFNQLFYLIRVKPSLLFSSMASTSLVEMDQTQKLRRQREDDPVEDLHHNKRIKLC